MSLSNPNTAAFTPSHPSPSSQKCHLCTTSSSLQTCTLCARPFCPTHQSSTFTHVCAASAAEHSTYHHDHPNLPDVYPSIGEREMALMSSPTDPEQSKEIDEFVRVEKERRVQAGLGFAKEELVEERDMVGADVAV